MPYWTGRYSWFGAYLASKYANVLFARELAARSDPARLTAVACSPGTTNTSIDRYLSPTLRFLFRYMGPGLAAQSVGAGAATVALCATAADIEPGAFYAQCRVQRCRESPWAVPPNKAARCQAGGCGETFFLLPGRHHCRSCGLTVCGAHFQRPVCTVCAALPAEERDVAKRLWRASANLAETALAAKST